jgi:hypothetical protein
MRQLWLQQGQGRTNAYELLRAVHAAAGVVDGVPALAERKAAEVGLVAYHCSAL